MNDEQIAKLFSVEILKELVTKYGTPESVKAAWETRHANGEIAHEEEKTPTDINSLKNRVKELHQKRAAGHVTLNKKLNELFSDNSKFIVTGRLKTPQSIQEKMERKNVNDPSKFDDISGLRVITSDARATQDAIKIIKDKFKGDIKPGSEDNYIENPKDTGYHAYHATIMANGEPHEVQVRTRRFNEWAETYHSVYKGETWAKDANTMNTKKYFAEMANVYQAMDEGRTPGHIPECPQELRKIGLCLGA